jgi:PhnB protein
MQNHYLSPYLVFNGNCKEAINFYHTCMGGNLRLQTFGEAPMPCPEDYKGKIMHASLENDSLSFMGSDTMPGTTQVIGSNIHMSVAGTDTEKLNDMFKKLSAGGTITMPLAKQFWGDTFGMFTDIFGIHWMFNISDKRTLKK